MMEKWLSDSSVSTANAKDWRTVHIRLKGRYGYEKANDNMKLQCLPRWYRYRLGGVV